MWAPLAIIFYFTFNCGSCYALEGQIVWYGHPLGSIFHCICDNICLQTHNSCHSGMENGKCYLMDAHIILFVLQGHSSYHSCVRNGKCYLLDAHTIYCGNIVSGWHNGHYSCMRNGKCYLMNAHTTYCGNIVSRWCNGHYSCMQNGKCYLMDAHII